MKPAVVHNEDLVPIGGVVSDMATPEHIVLENIERNHLRGLPEIHTLAEWREHMPLAIVGGGPSLKETIDELRKFDKVVACGSVHDHLVLNGVTPRWTVLCDPDPIVANYLKYPQYGCTYLVASQCHDNVFDALRGLDVVLWHCGGNLEVPSWQNRQMVAIGGGSTVLTRTIVIAMLFGYSNLHFFGCDNCIEADGTHHAYASESIGAPVPVRLENGREFVMAQYMLAQLFDFKKLLWQYANRLQVTVHGDGALAELMRLGEAKARSRNAA